MSVIRNNLEYFLYDELKELIILELRNDIISKAEKTGHKFIGDINKIGFTKALIGKRIKDKGYKLKLIQINKVKLLYYYYDI